MAKKTNKESEDMNKKSDQTHTNAKDTSDVKDTADKAVRAATEVQQQPKKDRDATKEPLYDLWQYMIDYNDLPEKLIPLALARRDFGLKKYGTTLGVYDGRDTLTEVLQGKLDALVYIFKGYAESGVRKHHMDKTIDLNTADQETINRYNNYAYQTDTYRNLYLCTIDEIFMVLQMMEKQKEVGEEPKPPLHL